MKSLLYKPASCVVLSVVALTGCASLATEGSSQATDLGSSSASSAVDAVAANNYLEKNVTQVKVDVARGTGEHLQALAAYYKVTPAQQAKFATLLQRNFAEIFVHTPADARGLKVDALVRQHLAS